MSNPLVPIAISSEIDAAGDERIHMANTVTGVSGRAAYVPPILVNVVLNVYNSNAVLDDQWTFYVNGQQVAIYSGDGAANTTWAATVLSGTILTLSAFVTAERNDNLFRVTLSVNGIQLIDEYIADFLDAYGDHEFFLNNPVKIGYSNYQVGDGGIVKSVILV